MLNYSKSSSPNCGALTPLKDKNLNTRPRLISLESNDAKAYNICGSSSSESPGLFKDLKSENFIRENRQRTYSFKLNRNNEAIDKLSIISYRCVHERNSVGFTPLSHSICIDEIMTSEDEPEEDAGIEFDRFPFNDDGNFESEDAAIACYKSKCNEINKTPLFNIHRENAYITEQVTDLQMRMRGIRETYMKISKFCKQ
ncbi:unnamed protein product [Blepharisma stoltei]|uniref:Uncharacterized protein n=1 Tax=Blepharisma stoltei TaxID=1481888 RepID=A0AAU9IKI0_9CILI|nr:unnamed protein product [Blepharisma stoltei]